MRDRETLGSNNRLPKRVPSVVGSKLSDISSRIPGRGSVTNLFGKVTGTAQEKDAAEGTASRALRLVAMVSGGLVVLLVSVAIALAILSNTPAFSISKVEAVDTEHVKGDDVVQLANVGKESTLLNLDVATIENNVKHNPWVKSIDVERVFPDTIRIHVNERKLGAIVVMGSGNLAWLMGDDQVWIEPLRLDVDEFESANDEALEQAALMGVLLISDVPSSVQPAAGTMTTDKSILAAFSVMGQLSHDFRERIVCCSASSEEDISCILNNGVEVSIGSDNNVRNKEAVAKRVLDEFVGKVTYINVRVPSHPTYRRVDSDYVREGTGATGSATDEDPVLPQEHSTDSSRYSPQSSQPDSEYVGDEYESYDEYGNDGYDYDEYAYDEYSESYGY